MVGLQVLLVSEKGKKQVILLLERLKKEETMLVFS